MTVRIVTDSTCDLPQAVVEKYQIKVLPSYINVGSDSYLDGVNLSRQEFYQRLPHYAALPTTAAPSPGVFTQVYEELAAEGATDVVSIHVSSTLSGFLNAARLGADATNDVQVTLFDSRQLSMGLGLLVQTAAEAAAEGRPVDAIVTLLNERVQRAYVVAVLDTLEFLRRSGRVSWTEFSLATLLKVKPLIKVYDGEALSAGRVRTWKRAMGELVDLIGSLAPFERAAVLHTNAPEEAQALYEQVKELLPAEIDGFVEVTPAIGAHIGPGAVGLACIRAA